MAKTAASKFSRCAFAQLQVRQESVEEKGQMNVQHQFLQTDSCGQMITDWMKFTWLEHESSNNAVWLILILHNATVHLSSLGATILKFLTESSDDENECIDIVAGYKDPKTFHDTGNPHFFNGIVGRVANRIAGGKFSLNKKSYSIFTNDPPNTLHGGKVGIRNSIWDATIIRDGSAVRFSLRSPDGDEGFPGNPEKNLQYCMQNKPGFLIRFLDFF